MMKKITGLVAFFTFSFVLVREVPALPPPPPVLVAVPVGGNLQLGIAVAAIAVCGVWWMRKK